MMIDTRRSLLAFGWLFLTCAISRGNFLGTDSLANPNSKWQPGVDAGNPIFAHQNSRLEFLVSSPESANRGTYLWLPNAGSYQKGWFVQVEAHLNQPVIPNASQLEAGIMIEGTSANSGSCSQLMFRGRYLGIDQTATVFRNGEAYVSGSASKAANATLRIHFDPVTKHLIGSVNTGSGWVYSSPVMSYGWQMNGADTFNASLVAGNSAEAAGGLSVFSGAVWFKNFRCGPATSEVDVKQIPGGSLRDGADTTQFGTVALGKTSVRTYSVLSEGTKDLKKLKLVIDGRDAKDFRVTTRLTSDVQKPGVSQRFKVTYRPTSKGTSKAKLHVLSDDPNEASFDIRLEGKATK